MKKPKVAILGASGIGKFHAREFHKAGCDVVAILGSTEESAARTAEELRQEFNIQARPYHDLETLFSSEELDAVSICTPPKLHSSQVRKCLEAGLHVLCEKPFVLDTKDKNYQIAKDLLTLAKEKGKILTVNTQWVSIVPYLEKNFDLKNIKSFSMYMEPPIMGGLNLITEAIPHANSMLLGLTSNKNLLPDSIKFPISNEEEIIIKFNYGKCEALYHFKLKEQRPRKLSFTLNGTEFVREIRENYSQQLIYDGKAIDIPDPLAKSINAFIEAISGEGSPLVDERDILDNIRIQDLVMKEYLSRKSKLP